jgi:hypothetical protein
LPAFDVLDRIDDEKQEVVDRTVEVLPEYAMAALILTAVGADLGTDALDIGR